MKGQLLAKIFLVLGGSVVSFGGKTGWAVVVLFWAGLNVKMVALELSCEIFGA